MDKKTLRAIPRPEATRKIQDLGELIRHQNKKSYIATADVSEGMLIINIFEVGPEGEKVLPFVRSFFAEDDYITQDLQSEKTVWKTGALMNVVGWYWGGWKKSSLTPASKKDKNTIIKWCKAYCDKRKKKIIGTDIEDYIDRYQDDIRAIRLKKKHDKEREFIESRMTLFDEEPDKEAFDEWVDKEAMFFHNFIIYDWKKRWAYCTRCKHELVITEESAKVKGMEFIEIKHHKPVHNRPYICPFCYGSELQRHEPGKEFKSSLAKSIGMSRSNMAEIQWVIVPAVVEDNGEKVITIRYISAMKDYRKDFRNPKISYFERYRSIHKEKESENYEWDYDQKTESVCWIPEKNRPYFWNPSEVMFPRNGAIPYMPDPLFYRDTWAKYCCMEQFKKMYEMETRKDVSPWFMERYLNFFRDNPYIEKVIKVGWSKLTEQIVDGTGSYTYHRDDIKDLLNQDAATLPDLLGLSRDNFLMMKKITNNPSWRDVQILRYAQQAGEMLSEKDYNILRFFMDAGYEDQWKKLLDCKKYSTINKLERYIAKNAKDRSQDYFDYLEWTEKMGYDMKNEFNLFPKDFKKTHDERSKEYQKQKDRLQREAIKKFNKLLKRYKQETVDVEALNMNIDGLFIRLPNDLKELTKEGEALHHCVGTYKEKVMKGETTILFIRKISQPDKPYYTLEWREGKVVQCRGMKNCDMTPEVKAFVEVFKIKMAAYEQEQMKVRMVS